MSSNHGSPGEIRAHWLHEALLAVWTQLSLQVSAFEGYQAVGEGVHLPRGDVLAAEPHEVGEGHHGPAHHELHLLLALGYVAVPEAHVVKPGLGGYLRGHAQLLGHTVHKVEMHLREHHGQRQAREAAAAAEIEHPASVGEFDELGYGQ